MSIASASAKTGYYIGTGATLNVAVGFMPACVEVYDMTNGTICGVGFPGKFLAFTTGVVAPALGAKVTGLTSGAKAQVKDVLITSGSFAGGNAAGFIVFDADTFSGAFSGAENLNFSNDTTGGIDAANTAAAVEDSLYQSAALGFVAGAGVTAITSYVGAAGSAAKGFTVGSSLSVAGRRYRWVANR